MSQFSKTELALRLISGQAKLQKRLNGPLSMHGIGLSEYLVLERLKLSEHGKLRRTDLAEQVGLTPSGITRLINPMEKIGLVEKEANPRDARVSFVSLTGAGRQIHSDASATFEQASQALFAALSESELEQLESLLSRI